MRRFIAKILILIIPLMFIIIGDKILGYLYDDLAPEWGKRHLNYVLNPTVKSITQTTIKPFLNYSNSPNYYQHGVKQHNADGYRNTYETFTQKSENEFRILCIGGSTTYGSGVKKPREAWPELLNKKFEVNKPQIMSSKKIVVINGGLAWGTSGELLTQYLFKHLYYKPDLIIVHTGGNDVGPLGMNNFSVDYSHWRSIEASGSSSLRPLEKMFIESSNYFKFFYSIWFNKFGFHPANLAISTKMWDHLTPADISKNIKSNPVIAYGNNLTNLFQIIKKSNAVPVFFQFYRPSLERLKNFNKAAFNQATNILGENLLSWSEYLEVGFNRLQKEAKTNCMNNNVEFWEIEKNSIAEKHFIDQCHLNREGQEFKAQFVYDKISKFLDE